MNNFFFIFRIFIGLILCLSGFEKVTQPYQNFLYILQAYQLFPSGIEKIIAMVVPWLELIVGIFLILGLWLSITVRAAIFFFMSFVFIIAQALIRKIPLEECGCFGELIHINPHVMLMIDSGMLIISCLMYRHLSKTSRFSLDQYFSK